MNILEQVTVVKHRVGRAVPVVTDDGRRRPPRRVRVAGEHGGASFGPLALRRVDGQRNRVQARWLASGTRTGFSASVSTTMPLMACIRRVDVVVPEAGGT